MLNDAYEREYDPETDSWFYVNKVRVCCTYGHNAKVRRVSEYQVTSNERDTPHRLLIFEKNSFTRYPSYARGIRLFGHVGGDR